MSEENESADDAPAVVTVQDVIDDVEDMKVKLQLSALSALFDPVEVRWKPQTVSKDGSRAMVVAYVDARCVMDRLDSVLGAENWSEESMPIGDGNVMCKLSVKLGNRWITKSDVGTPSMSEPIKGAFSDALKRAAVRFGVGRYLYKLPQQWCNYDPKKKCLTETPKLPDWAIPTTLLHDKQNRPQSIPANGQELDARLKEYDRKMASKGLCSAGAVVAHVMLEGQKRGFPDDMSKWDGPAIAFSVEVVRAFEKQIYNSRIGNKAAKK